jgi:glycosyltransferase involved in cell wall biosynthesis
MNGSMSPFVSVIIPVFNDSDRLKLCLRALAVQTYAKELYEVIVIDNGSDEPIETIVNQFQQASLSYEGDRGSYAARNKGISIAKGQVLAFTDSDCIPASNWLETGVTQLLSMPNCGLVAGRVDVFFRDPTCPTAVELYDHVTYFQQKQYVEEHQYGATANLFTFKQIFADVGYFNAKLKSGGDMEWGQRVVSFGYLGCYAENSCVAHPARYSLDQLYKKIVRTSRGHYELGKFRNEDDRSFLIQFITDLSGLRPPLRSVFRKVFSEKKLENNQQKVQVFLIELFVHYAKFIEKMRWHTWQILSHFQQNNFQQNEFKQ